MLKEKAPTLIILLSIVAILLLLTGVVIPLILSSQLSSSMQNFAFLSRENYEKWSSIPGPYNFSLLRSFQFYEYLPSGSPSQEKQRFKRKPKLDYKILRSIGSTEYVDSHASVSYLYSEQHTPLNENTMDAELETVSTVNIGALSAWYQLTHREDYKRIVPVMYAIISSMKTNMIATIIAREAFEFYVKDKDMVFTSILKGIDKNTATKIYSDPTYGMGNNVTLKEWFRPLLVKATRTHPKYIEIQSHFGLSQAEMVKIYDVNGMLRKLGVLMLHLMKQKYNCKYRDCTEDELAFSQLTNQTVTRNPLVDYSSLAPIESYKDLNPDLILPPEIAYFRTREKLNEEEKKVFILNTTLKQIFDVEDFGAKRSILNPINAEKFFTQMEAGYGLQDLHYAYVLGIKSMPFYTFLFKYLKYCISTFADFTPLGGGPKDTALAELSLLAGNVAISHLSKNIQPLLYSRLLAAKFASESVKCATLFPRIETGKIQRICADPGFNFTQLFSYDPWVRAAIFGKGTSEYNSIQSRFELNDTEIVWIMNSSINASLGWHIKIVKKKAAVNFACANINECELIELVALQWGSSAVSLNASLVYGGSPFIKRDYSIQSWMPASDLEPQEYYYYAVRHYQNESLDTKINATVGAMWINDILTDQFDLTRFIIYARSGKYEDINREFGVKKGYMLLDYLRRLTENNVFGSAYVNRTQRELMWGFYDPFLSKLRSIKYSQNGDPAFKHIISVGPLNVPFTTPGAEKPLNQLFTGHSGYHKVRTYSRYLGSPTINIWEEFYNGQSNIYHYRNPYQRNIPVDGTDSFQFSPGLDPENSIKYFDDFAMRPIEFNYNSEVSQGQLEVLKYSMKEGAYENAKDYADNFGCPLMNTSSVFEIPIFVGLPWFKKCRENAVFKNVEIDGQMVSTLNQSETSFFWIEPKSGITTKLEYGFEVVAYLDDNIAFPSLPDKVAFPVLSVKTKGEYSNKELNRKFETLISSLSEIRSLRISLLVIGALFAVAALILVIFVIRFKKRNEGNIIIEPVEDKKENKKEE